MNLQLSHLALSSVFSSLILTGNSWRNVGISESRFDRSISCLFYSNMQNRFNFAANRVVFSNFLVSSIQIIRLEHENMIINKTLVVENDSKVVISKCSFENCKSNENGGSILIDNIEADINILDSVFISSVSEKHGGAIYANVRNANIKNCVFSKCYAGPSFSYQSYYFCVGQIGSFELCAVQQCGVSKEYEGFSTIGIRQGITTTKDLNSSSNSILSWGSGISVVNTLMSSVVIEFCSFFNNSQTMFDVFCFHNSNNMCDLHDNNFVQNEGSKNGMLFAAITNAYIYVRNSVIYHNNVGSLATISDLAVVLFENCVLDVDPGVSKTVHNIDCLFSKKDITTIPARRIQ